MDKSLRTEFDRVDRTTDPADFVRYLDAARATDYYREIKARSYSLLDLRPGDHLCDVGCGTGDDVLALAQYVKPGGRVVGVDVSETMIGEAERRAVSAGWTLGEEMEFKRMDGIGTERIYSAFR